MNHFPEFISNPDSKQLVQLIEIFRITKKKKKHAGGCVEIILHKAWLYIYLNKQMMSMTSVWSVLWKDGFKSLDCKCLKFFIIWHKRLSIKPCPLFNSTNSMAQEIKHWVLIMESWVPVKLLATSNCISNRAHQSPRDIVKATTVQWLNTRHCR